MFSRAILPSLFVHICGAMGVFALMEVMFGLVVIQSGLGGKREYIFSSDGRMGLGPETRAVWDRCMQG